MRASIYRKKKKKKEVLNIIEGIKCNITVSMVQIILRVIGDLNKKFTSTEIRFIRAQNDNEDKV